MNRKKAGKLFLLFILLFSTFTFSFVDIIEAKRASSLPNSFHSHSNGYGSAITPTSVPNYIRNLELTRNNQANKGGSDLSKRLVYDIYTGNSSNARKGGFKVETSNLGDGRQDYITFTGWSVLYLHHHHTPNNQETYIRARNTETNETKTFLTQQTSLGANRDLSSTGYPGCPDNAYNRRATQDSNACNFDYQWTSFKAWLPLEELFPEGTRHAEWELSIIKVVGYSSNYSNNQIVWDELRLPFSIGEINYNGGKVRLESEYQSGDRMLMISRNVLRRSEPRGSTNLNPRYFTTGRQYIYNNVHDDGDETANWYRVEHSSEGRAWGASPHFQYTGQQARLSFNMGTKSCPDGTTKYVDEDCTVNITILHVDQDTGEQLDREVFNRKVGTNYSFSPKRDGYFEDSEGNPYIAYPSNQSYSGRVNNSNFTRTFFYRIPSSNPTTIKEIPNGSEGLADGQFLWRLEKANDSDESRLRMINNVSINGTHFETRNINYSIVSSNSGGINERSSNPINIYVGNPNDLKGQTLTYSFEYEYTNHYQENYECVDSQGSYCFEWRFTGNTPVWGNYANREVWTQSLNVDHNYGETFTISKGDSTNLSMVVSRQTDIDGNRNSMSNSTHRESLTIDRKDTKLYSQTWKDVLEKVEYQSDLNNNFYIIDGDKFYYPNDIDDNLRTKYENETSFSLGNYAIPLRISSLNGNEVSFVTEDNFFITKKTGFVFSLPSSETNKDRIEALAKEQYENYTGNDYNDSVLTTLNEGSRYYINIDLAGEQEPNVEYSDNVVLGRLGLNDITVQLMQTLEFDHYLFGHFSDEPIFVEQRTSVIPNIEYENTIRLTKNQIDALKEIERSRTGQIHSFRATDDQKIYEQVNGVVSLD